jgi:hypothetical protein
VTTCACEDGVSCFWDLDPSLHERMVVIRGRGRWGGGAGSSLNPGRACPCGHGGGEGGHELERCWVQEPRLERLSSPYPEPALSECSGRSISCGRSSLQVSVDISAVVGMIGFTCDLACTCKLANCVRICLFIHGREHCLASGNTSNFVLILRHLERWSVQCLKLHKFVLVVLCSLQNYACMSCRKRFHPEPASFRQYDCPFA